MHPSSSVCVLVGNLSYVGFFLFSRIFLFILSNFTIGYIQITEKLIFHANVFK